MKPPGGGHSNIFSAPDQIKPHARPKYDQQNSSNLNFCMNTQDPNEKVAKVAVPHHDDEPTPNVAVPAAVEISAPAVAPAHDEPPKPQNLPQYHHHRSTALW